MPNFTRVLAIKVQTKWNIDRGVSAESLSFNRKAVLHSNPD